MYILHLIAFNLGATLKSSGVFKNRTIMQNATLEMWIQVTCRGVQALVVSKLFPVILMTARVEIHWPR
jgi:hypothetical protein